MNLATMKLPSRNTEEVQYAPPKYRNERNINKQMLRSCELAVARDME